MTISRKQVYSGQQILIMAVIVLFIFPALIWAFRALVGVPFILLSLVVEFPTEGVWFQILGGVQLVALLFSFIASLWVCYKIWPRRKVIDS